MTKTDAMIKYLGLVSRLDAEWEKSSLDSDSQSTDSDNGSDSVGLSVSTLAGRDVEEEISDEKKTLFDWCKEGNERKLQSLLSSTNVNQTDSDVSVCVCVCAYVCVCMCVCVCVRACVSSYSGLINTVLP